ncbi:DHH family phosphoesterase [Mycoplasma elephantis]|uniref:DHH family phosphoesterase n=1 Tax=Mycoplasma elephantis TaxID=114882 RepID=UPI00048100F0|nr:bifunctional oligoribonuclease/PAP phosphatase NrnA [Mycoplasma elephantis]
MKIGNWKEVIKIIEKHDNIIIFHHIRPDGDCLGSQSGLAELIKNNYSNKSVYIIGDNENNYNFLDFKFNNSIDINYENSLGIVVDVGNKERIKNVEILLEDRITHRLRIDHHPTNSDIKFDYEYIDSSFCAAAELITDLAIKSKWLINNNSAKYLYLGINTDSGRFLYPGVKPRTFNCVAKLIKQANLDIFEIHNELYKKTLLDLRIQSHILSNFKKDGKVLYYIATKKIQDLFNISSSDIGKYNNLLSNIEDNYIWLFFIEIDKNTYRVRLRSNGPKINKIAMQFNGGGHAYASGATIYKKSDIKKIIDMSNIEINKLK